MAFAANTASAQDEQAAPAAEEVAAPAEMNAADLLSGTGEEIPLHQALKTKFIEGGAGFMSLIIICLIIGMALAIERILYLAIFKVGFSSIGTSSKDDCGAQTITTRRVLFQPESQRVVVGQTTNKQGKIVQKFVVAKTLVKDVVFEETYDTSLKPEATNSGEGSGGEGGNG